ncbi:3-hydroxyacyl-acp dehydratase : Polyketide synthase family protein OS=Singulisphaera acidiphila (strain ATCC BAA-1392 / DSM 18658 / VKM B-2454 / MOB10) GN=Sinac_3637 PE=4 SV=1: ketoacyl-synt: Ketoacyl-synt_C: ketoacyl-synt: FabA: FabA [Gemmata massiliana]|uniref:Ketosynthase family 3 (KS3) domain-containing protein n=1 Tax=Gemmata massiliana TaxID=1210884 RepID=A0A6P2DDQ7_9BACT|nr:beta-ketoacyl synthase N-terminal-like domain-containing protein [Gemmata massiliana]VTR99523.1 3-hydroxyacyl-acp dehydratase : Polyketide synthase family protein OS=Singulisphaera acidiphila (strain ATCC BAA-1392 / DSM 18658 / VKM B-2454 / MOB10) GN=Sinac_3637 PE=4 SV=1: ketoacyl-synt: Ketoacyl-synt_C: ketoacyl-synt: FabA: FabA [Gemmata massiliana]
MTERIAIVSFAGRFPGAGSDLDRFWANVSAAADCSREVPASRWALPPDRCADPRVANPDTVYSARGYYLDPFDADLTDLDLDAGLVRALDPLFHLVLDTGNRAWRGAETARVDRSRVGVVLGNICLPTDRVNDLCREVLGAKAGLPTGTPTHPLNRFVAGLPAGMLAKGLRFGGGNFTLDAACASSLYAIKLAADELLAGRADAMLAGGCSRPDCQYTQMGFAQLRALAVSGRCSPFDTRADGLVVGEGAGVFVLKRLSDALAHGDTIHGVIAGVGLSNDMHGNLLAPAKEGQLRAMHAAYARAGWHPQDVQLIECHATGTPVGDAIEFDSLRELWGESGWAPGQAVIGSVKSTVGHLLTGAGAAALTKVLLAMRAEQLPPQANFAEPAAGLRYANGPFKLLSKPERWGQKSGLPRRAAVSGFGFGGVNAHLLVEEWTGSASANSARTSPPKFIAVNGRNGSVPPEKSQAAEAIAVVGMGAHVGSWGDARALQEYLLNGESGEAHTKTNGWALASEPCPPGFYIDELKLPIDKFRIPPKELEETLPQQLLALQVAAAALDDQANGRPQPLGDGDPTTGVFIGLGLDPNTTNFHLRWSAIAAGANPDDASPPLTANRTMGALGSIAASRIARAFHFGGPSHTVCSEEGSAARAIELGVRALQAHELDRALVGGVDLAGDPRLVLPGEARVPGEGAVALVLKRLTDAERDGDRVYAVIRGTGVAADADTALARAAADAGVPRDSALALDDAPALAGDTGATSGAVNVLSACLALYQEMLPNPSPTPPLSGEGLKTVEGSVPPSFLGKGVRGLGSPCYWLHNRIAGPRRAHVRASGADGSHFAFVLEEHAAKSRPAPDRAQPLGARGEAVFVVDGDTPADLLAGIEKCAAFVGARRERNIEAVAREWFRTSAPDSTRARAVTFVSRSVEEFEEQLGFAAGSLHADPNAALPVTARAALRDRVFYSPAPLGSGVKLAFVFPGSGNQFDGMGRALGAHWPEVLRRQHAESEQLRDQYAPHLFWTDRTADALPRDLMFGQVTVGTLVSDIAVSLGIRPDAMIGLSLGESAGLFGVRVWLERDEMYRRMQRSTLFASDLAPPYASAQRYLGTPANESVDWVSGVIAASAADVSAALRPESRAYLLIVNTPNECVIGGLRPDVEQLAADLGKSVLLLEGVTLAHCEAGRPVEGPYHELHVLPVTPQDVTIYSGARGSSYKPSERACADSITAGLVGVIDVPRVIESTYSDGVRAFIEIGPGNSCTRMISAILGDRPHFARAAHAAKQDAVSQVLRLVAHLVAERLPVDLAALYGTETRCVGHRAPEPGRRNEVVIPVGMRPVARKPVAPEPVVRSVTPKSNAPRSPAVVAEPPKPKPTFVEAPQLNPHATARSAPSPHATSFATAIGPVIESAANVQVLNMQAQEVFLRVNGRLMESAANVVRFQTALLETWMRGGQSILPMSSDGGADLSTVLSPSPLRGGVGEGLFAEPNPPAPFPKKEGGEEIGEGLASVPRALTYEQCCAFAAGRVADALGPVFAEVDSFPTRVRLPDGPLQLVDRITLIEGEPKSMTTGRVVTEHTVHSDRWYLQTDRIPTAICVESGQADLFLSGYLGIDFETRGLAVYRLLDAVVSFHRGLPKVGETIVYDIHIDRFVQQAGAWLFHFWFDGTVNGEPLITMRNGVAGFFTAEALAAGKGIVQTTLDKQRLPGKKPSDWTDLVPQTQCALDLAQVDALRAGDLATAFGADFARASLRRSATIPGGMLRLVGRVPLIDPTGGRFGIGFVRAEFDIHPDDWFLTCHFVDDQVMPGTLMYECCLHTLRVLLMRMGWVGEADEVVYEPVPGVNSRLKCRGQVIASTKTVTYEVTVKELGYRPEPFCIADALMYADGKPIVEITNMTLRMTGLTRERLGAIWAGREEPNPLTPFPKKEGGTEPKLRDAKQPAVALSPSPLGGGVGEGLSSPLYDSASIMAYSNGKPSEAFGAPYKVFDSERIIARLPGPPYQFLDCITAVTGEPFVLKAGASCEAKYAVPPYEWYFDANRCENMPFSVLLEIALQPCGWLAAYCGSALTSKDDLSFRNLGGKGTQFRAVTPSTGTLTTTVKMTNVSNSAGMIIQHYDMLVRDDQGDVYKGTTYFGFFSKPALANQVGIRDAKVPWPSERELMRAQSEVLPHGSPFPGPMLRMVDRVTAYIPDGGAKGLGLVVGAIKVDPEFWFFKAHFYQDPVWPGSLGVESFLQLLKFAAWKRWGNPEKAWHTVARNAPHTWVYRGQVLPTDGEVTVVLEIVAADDDHRHLTANGFLTVDGRVIYQMTDFTLE